MSGTSQRRDYRNGYYERDFVTRFGTSGCGLRAPGSRTFCPGAGEVSAAGAGGGAADPGGVSARHLHPASGAGGGHAHGRIGERANRFATDARSGRGGAAVSSSATGRRMGVSVSGWSELAGAPAQRAKAGADAGGVWSAARRHPPTAGLSAKPAARARADWEGCLQDLYRRGLEGKHLQLIVTDGCPGLAAAIQTVYPRGWHQRCWVHKMRNILEKVRKRDYHAVKADAQAIYLAESRSPGRKPRSAAFAGVGSAVSDPWCGNWNATCRSYCRSSACPGICGGSCALPISSSAASWRCAANSAHGLLRQCAERGADHLLHLPALQPGMENPHPPRFYTSSLTSPISVGQSTV